MTIVDCSGSSKWSDTKQECHFQDNSGTIEKDELRELFRDMFPNFHK